MKKLFILLSFAFTLCAAQAQVVIYEVYGGGGSTSAGPIYRNDYLVLLNKGAASVTMTGWSVQYASTTGPSSGTWAKVDITGAATIAAGSYFLVKMSPDQNTSNVNYMGAALPTPDISLPTSLSAGGLTMSASGGKVALVNNGTALTTTMPATANIVDLVGWGSATFFEGTAAAPATTNTSAVKRINNGQDTNQNGADFALNTTPTPLNSVIIPVEMTTFSAKKAGNANKLAWQTATELNNQYFDVQRSTDGATFQTIGQVKGVGNSAALNNYEYMDETPALGTNYYRLQQVDYDGKTTTSKTVAVSTTGKGSTKVFPTLATDKINVLTASDKEEIFTITNMVGQTLLTGRVVNSLDINISQLAKGIYILRIADDVVKFSKQ